MWLAALAAWHRSWWLLPLALLPAAAMRRAAPVAVVLVIVGVLSGGAARERSDDVLLAAIPEGPARLVADVVDDQRRGGTPVLVVRPAALGVSAGWSPWRGPALAMPVLEPPIPDVGSRVVVAGTLVSSPRLVRGDPVAGTIRAARVEGVREASNPALWVGNAMRRRVQRALADAHPMLPGFLIGDTSGVDDAALEDLRRSGLTHFVAVSGSNVALVLGVVFVVTGPLAWGLRRRAVIGLVTLAVFAVATRWEPSVLRASVMAGLLLTTAALGIPMRPWVVLAAGTAVLLAVSGQLAGDVGFQLSVVATAGVIAGTSLFAGRRPGWLWSTLGAAVGAQGAVVPLLLVHFGSVPLLSPIANLLAAPLVTTATVTGALAVVFPWQPLAGLASLAASAVGAVAAAAGEWPQLGWAGVSVVAAGAVLARARRLRPLVAAVAVVAVAIPMMAPHRSPAVPTATFLDVGQGDATLVEDPSGGVILVDGGPDAVILQQALRSRRIDRIDLLVATHGDADHVAGLEGILDRIGVAEMWVPAHADLGDSLEGLVADAEERGVAVRAVSSGARARLGALQIEVLGPARRYEAQNDGSIVVLVSARSTLLLPGDVEAVAQQELPALRPDVLLVPHHGSATTDLRWLEATVGDVAVISVGANTFGHPAPEVVDLLHRLGVEVAITHEEGDVVIPLG